MAKSYGEKHGNSKLSDSDIREIRQLLEAGYKAKDLAESYRISRGYVYLIKHHRTRPFIR